MGLQVKPTGEEVGGPKPHEPQNPRSHLEQSSLSHIGKAAPRLALRSPRRHACRYRCLGGAWTRLSVLLVVVSLPTVLCCAVHDKPAQDGPKGRRRLLSLLPETASGQHLPLQTSSSEASDELPAFVKDATTALKAISSRHNKQQGAVKAPQTLNPINPKPRRGREDRTVN